MNLPWNVKLNRFSGYGNQKLHIKNLTNLKYKIVLSQFILYCLERISSYFSIGTVLAAPLASMGGSKAEDLDCSKGFPK